MKETFWQWAARWIEFLFTPQWARSSFPGGTATREEGLHSNRKKTAHIPQYVLEYAPLIHLYSDEEFWPCDILEHLHHTTAYLNYTQLDADDERRTLHDLAELNVYHRFAYLMSDDNVEDRPEWLGGNSNIPDVPDKNPNKTGGRSDAPVTLVVVDKGSGIVDAFWFFFYSYNLGNSVLNTRFGNHVGDWEHTLVRFKDGEPDSIFFSEHSWGDAYSYAAVEKIGKRPVGYSASGTHAMYGTPGLQTYVLPWGLLHDITDRGPLWDPIQNLLSYTFDMKTHTVQASNFTPDAPTEWFYFEGHWGDKAYPMSDKRQYDFIGLKHYVDGPLGPRWKNLGRKTICQGGGECHIKHWRDPVNVPRVWDEGWKWEWDDHDGMDF